MEKVQAGLLVAHILLAVVIIGPLLAYSTLVPGLIRGGADNLPTLRTINKVHSRLGPATISVFILGVALVLHSHKEFTFKTHWVSASMALFVVALVIGAVFIAGTEEKAIEALEGGTDASPSATKIRVLAGIQAVIIVVILVLMVYKPVL